MSVKPRRLSIHAINAVALSLFIAVHISVNLSAWGGAGTHAVWRDAARAVYQHPVVETLLFAVVLAQVVTGLRFAWRRRGRLWTLQTLSGLYLAMFLVMHASATIGTRRLYGLDTDYAWAAGSLAYGAVGAGFALYYALALLSLTVHLGTAFARMRRRRPHRRILIGMGAALAVAVLLPFTPLLRDDPLPERVQSYYHALYGWTGQVPAPHG